MPPSGVLLQEGVQLARFRANVVPADAERLYEVLTQNFVPDDVVREPLQRLLNLRFRS